jgi:transcriptional regulator
MDVLHSTLDLLILEVLSEGPLHGWAISQRIRERSKAALQVNQGTLYPALHRLEEDGILRATWTQSDTQRRVKSYELTRPGERRLLQERNAWRRYTSAIELVVQTR